MRIDYDNIVINIRQKKYSLIGYGTGRVVYDLGNGYVVKVAKNKKGIAQNKAENQIYSMNDTEYFAKILAVSEDFRFLIMEKAERISSISVVWRHFQVRNNRELFRLSIFQKFVTQYHLIMGDLYRRSSWGIVNGKLVIIDYGFTKETRRLYTIF